MINRKMYILRHVHSATTNLSLKKNFAYYFFRLYFNKIIFVFLQRDNIYIDIIRTMI